MKKYRIAELYAGTARSVEPFRHWRRAELALLLDASEYARATYALNYPNAPYLRRSISRLQAKEFATLANGKIDILLGCPPCQGFSENGLRLADDPRNWHVRKFATLADTLRPLAVVMENVPTVAGSAEFLYMTRLLEESGYKWSSTIANAAQYGSCQTRQRLLFIAFRKDVRVQPKFPNPSFGGDERLFSYSTLKYLRPADDPVRMLGITPVSQRLSEAMSQNMAKKLGRKPMVTVGDTLAALPRMGSAEADALTHNRWEHSKTTLRRMGRVSEGHQWKGGLDHFAHSYGRLHRRGLARTITTFFPYAGNGRFWHPTANRSLSIREAARIQGFPDGFRFLESSKRTAALVGNALDNALASICYSVVRQALE
jgi:DNA (cytosine-5)-methyltransferase 1